MTNPERMTVRRVTDRHGHSFEPPIDFDWPELTQLQWKAAVVSIEIGGGVELSVSHMQHDPDRFLIREHAFGFGIPGPWPRDSCWAFLNGMSVGSTIAAGLRQHMSTVATGDDHVSTGTIDDA